MIEVRLNDNSQASFEKAMKVFKKLVQSDGFMLEVRDRQFYKKPSVKKREKSREVLRKRKQEKEKNERY